MRDRWGIPKVYDMSTETDYRQAVAEELRVAMVRRRFTQAALAKRIGISRVALSERLACKRAFTTDHLIRAAEALDIDVADLLAPPANSEKAAS